MDDVAGLNRHVIDSLMAFRRLLANKHPRSGPVMTARSPRSVIVAKRSERHSLHIPRALPDAVRTSPSPLSDSVRACLYVSLSRGKERDRDGT